MKTTLFPVLLVAALFAGCKTEHGYVPSDRLREVKHPDRANLSDFKLAVDDLVGQLLDDDDYRESYEAFRASREDGRPHLMVGEIDNDSGARVDPYLANARTELRTRLRKAKLFTIVDDASSSGSVSEKIAAAITKNADAGLKKGASTAFFGQQADADYYLLGVYRQVDGEGVYSYLLELQLWNLATGEMEWSGTSEIDKK
jgi:hypothetical protein